MVSKVRKLSQVKDVASYEKAKQGFLFWKQAQGVSERTLLDYKKHLKQFFSRFPECWQSGSMKDSIMEYMSDDIMPATYNLRLIYLKAFFDWCVGEDMLSENCLKGFKKRKAQPRIVEISEDVLKRLLELPDKSTFAGLRDYGLLLFTLDTGIRPKEALLLTIADFDLDRRIVIIPASEAKTRKMRILPFLPSTAKYLSKLVSARHPSWGKDIPVFCSYAGTPLTAITWGDRLELYSKKLGHQDTSLCPAPLFCPDVSP